MECKSRIVIYEEPQAADLIGCIIDDATTSAALRTIILISEVASRQLTNSIIRGCFKEYHKNTEIAQPASLWIFDLWRRM